MKIVSKGRVLNSREFYKKKQRKKLIKFILLSIGLVLLVSLFIHLSRYERFLIVEVIVPGEEVIDKDKIVSAVENLLDGYYLWIIPRANSLLYPKRTIEESLFLEFPRLKSVHLGLSEIQTLTVTVEERKPFALYCLNFSECYFLDEEGFIFAIAPSFSGGAVYFIYTAKVPSEDPIGQTFMAEEEFKQLPNFIKTLSALNIYPVALEIGDDEYILFLPNGGEILWRRSSELAVIHANLEAFLSSDSIRAQSNFLDRILHLDLRTENKVFYKFRD